MTPDTLRSVVDRYLAAYATVSFRAVVARYLPNALMRGRALELTGRTEFAFREALISAIVDVS